MPSLRSALAWSAGERIARQLFQFVVGVMLARLLTPDDYGLIAMVTVFFAVASTFSAGGLYPALIQRPNLNPDDETTAFWVNAALGVAFGLLLFAAAVPISEFYAQPVLAPLIRVLSLQVPLTSLGLVQNALLARTMNFRRQAAIGLVATFASGGTAIAMALAGYGVWSLVAQGLAGSGIAVGLVWVASDWRPRGRFRWENLNGLWAFGSHALATNLLFMVFDNVYSLVIGRLYSPASLGLYTRANQLQQLPASMATEVIGRVTFPYFSAMQGDPQRIGSKLRALSRVLAAFYVPMMVGMAAAADTLIPLLLTDRWRGSVPYFRILCFAGALYPINAMHVSVMNALGRARTVFRLEVVKKFVLMGILLITFRLGVLAMVWGMLVQYLACAALNVAWCKRNIGYTYGQFARDILPYMAISLGCALVAVWLGARVARPGLPSFLAQALIGMSMYAGLVYALRQTLYADAWDSFWQIASLGKGDKSRARN